MGDDYYSNAGSGSKDLGPAGSPSEHKDTGERIDGPDDGALAAFGGITAATKIQRAHEGAVSIDRPGYPMDGEAASGT